MKPAYEFRKKYIGPRIVLGNQIRFNFRSLIIHWSETV